MERTAPGMNWSRTVEWPAARLASPSSAEELAAAVAAAEGGLVRVVGRGHSFNEIVQTEGLLISLAKMNSVIGLDEAEGGATITVAGGMTYSELFAALKETRWALPSTASMPHFTIAGAISTGTHGSSGVDAATGRVHDAGGNLGSSVCGLEFVLADGTRRRYGGDTEEGRAALNGAIVGLGCLGPIASVSLRLVPRYDVRQACYRAVPVPRLIDELEALVGSTDSFSAIVDFHLHTVRWLFLRKFVPHPAPEEQPAHPESLCGGTLSRTAWGDHLGRQHISSSPSALMLV